MPVIIAARARAGSSRLRRRPRLVPGLVATAFAMAIIGGCSSSGSGRTSATVPSNATIADPPAGSNSTTGNSAGAGSTSTSAAAGPVATLPPDTVIVNPGSSALGDILVDANNHALYIFTGDTSPTATCVGACAQSWAPVLGTQIGVAQSLSYTPGEFKMVIQPNGTSQLTANGRPVYTYKGDTKSGQTKGQGVGAQWYILGADGQPITKKS